MEFNSGFKGLKTRPFQPKGKKKKKQVLRWVFELNRVLHKAENWHLEYCVLNAKL